jgi:cobalt-zinc-cadmium efflux system protein
LLNASPNEHARGNTRSGSVLNGIVLGVSGVWVIVEAIHRLRVPAPVRGGSMMIVATLGLGVNLLSAWILSRGKTKNANVRAALAHVLADAAGSVAAMIAGAFVAIGGFTRADPIVSILISLLILWGAWRLVRDSTRTLMEMTPAGIDTAAIEATIRATVGVNAVHDLHVWAISDGFPLVTAHVVLESGSHGVEVARAVGERLRSKHKIEHATIQPEAADADFVPTSRLLTHGR